jgi:uncharacterized protein (UPF0332 family)
VKEENKKKNMEEELSHADESLKAARLLIDSQLFREAIPKLYYALFHVLRALLFTKGLEPKSHEGVSHYFNIHFVREGPFSHDQNRFFKRLMKYRHEADYGLGYEITPQDCNEWYEKIAKFLQEVKDYLKVY